MNLLLLLLFIINTLNEEFGDFDTNKSVAASLQNLPAILADFRINYNMIKYLSAHVNDVKKIKTLKKSKKIELKKVKTTRWS